MKSIIDYMIRLEKSNSFHVFDKLFDYNKYLINKIINWLINTITDVVFLDFQINMFSWRCVNLFKFFHISVLKVTKTTVLNTEHTVC